MFYTFKVVRKKIQQHRAEKAEALAVGQQQRHDEEPQQQQQQQQDHHLYDDASSSPIPANIASAFPSPPRGRRDASPPPIGLGLDLGSGVDSRRHTLYHNTSFDVTSPAAVYRPPSEPALDQEVVKRQRRVYRWKVVLGLFAPFLLQALDTTIVASAYTYIAQDFHQLTQANWIISVFNLTCAAFLPFWAQMTDVFGRHATLQTTIILVMIGSAICTGAPTYAFAALLLGRAIQGVGAAGVNICVRTILADRVTLSDYATNWTLFAVVAAVGYTVGPVIGGYLTETTWRWVFAVNLPVGALAIVLVIVFLRKELLGPQLLPELDESAGRRAKAVVRLGTVDFVGQLMFLFGFGLLILGLTWAGASYRWDAPAVLGPLIAGGVVSVSWFAYEYSMTPGRLMSKVFERQRPMMPWVLFANRDISLLFFNNFCLGMCMYAVMYFMNEYYVLVQHQTASNAGVSLLYFLPGYGVGAYMAMFFVNSWPRQTVYPILLGNIASAVGITVLAWAISIGHQNVIYGMMALAGYGVGVRMSPTSMHGLAHFPANTASITCIFAFAQPFGGLVGLTMMSTVFNNEDNSSAKQAIQWAFVSIIPFMWLCVLVTPFLGNVWVSKKGHHEVVGRPYLWSFLTGKGSRLVKEKRTRGSGDWSTLPANIESETAVFSEQKRGNRARQSA